jgi:hypothetical protein
VSAWVVALTIVVSAVAAYVAVIWIVLAWLERHARAAERAERETNTNT